MGAILVLSMVARGATAQDLEAGGGALRAKGSLYVDDDHTTIGTTLVDGQVGLPGRARVGAHVLADVISSASVDVVSTATERFDEVRLEAGGRAGIALEDVDLSVAFVHSAENDWQSYAPSATFAVEQLQKNLRLSAGYGFGYNEVGRADDPNFSSEMLTHSGQVSAVQIIDKKSLLGISYSLQHASGWLSSPYRFVMSGAGRGSLEVHPSTRLRHALTAHGLRYLARGVGLEASYRFYADDWGVLSHTLSAGLRLDFLEHFDLRLRGRGYYQTAATFWRESYDKPLRYMSADRELSTFWDAGGGVKIGFRYGGLEIDAKAEGLYYRFLDFSLLQSRAALVADLGVGYRW